MRRTPRGARMTTRYFLRISCVVPFYSSRSPGRRQLRSDGRLLRTRGYMLSPRAQPHDNRHEHARTCPRSGSRFPGLARLFLRQAAAYSTRQGHRRIKSLHRTLSDRVLLPAPNPARSQQFFRQRRARRRGERRFIATFHRLASHYSPRAIWPTTSNNRATPLPANDTRISYFTLASYISHPEPPCRPLLKIYRYRVAQI